MERNFTADISIKSARNSENIVKIIPFSDRDKYIASQLEKILNHELKYENHTKFEVADFNKRTMKEII